MASLLIRDLDDDVKARLRVRAAEHGRSMEAEARAIIAAAVLAQQCEVPTRGLGTYLHEMAMEYGGFEIEIDPRTFSTRKEVDFTGPEDDEYDDEK